VSAVAADFPRPYRGNIRHDLDNPPSRHVGHKRNDLYGLRKEERGKGPVNEVKSENN